MIMKNRFFSICKFVKKGFLHAISNMFSNRFFVAAFVFLFDSFAWMKEKIFSDDGREEDEEDEEETLFRSIY